MSEEKLIGTITHYYSKIGVAIVDVSDCVSVGDKVKIKGHSTEFEQDIDSIQVDHGTVNEANKNDVIGLKVNDKVREGDKLYKINNN